MIYRTRINYSVAQKAEIWDRWQRGIRPPGMAEVQILPVANTCPYIRRTGCTSVVEDMDVRERPVHRHTAIHGSL